MIMTSSMSGVAALEATRLLSLRGPIKFTALNTPTAAFNSQIRAFKSQLTALLFRQWSRFVCTAVSGFVSKCPRAAQKLHNQPQGHRDIVLSLSLHLPFLCLVICTPLSASARSAVPYKVMYSECPKQYKDTFEVQG